MEAGSRDPELTRLASSTTPGRPASPTSIVARRPSRTSRRGRPPGAKSVDFARRYRLATQACVFSVSQWPHGSDACRRNPRRHDDPRARHRAGRDARRQALRRSGARRGAPNAARKRSREGRCPDWHDFPRPIRGNLPQLYRNAGEWPCLPKRRRLAGPRGIRDSGGSVRAVPNGCGNGSEPRRPDRLNHRGRPPRWAQEQAARAKDGANFSSPERARAWSMRNR